METKQLKTGIIVTYYNGKILKKMIEEYNKLRKKRHKLPNGL